MKTETKQSLVKRILAFIQEVKQETKKVTWPSRRETTLTTVVVFIFAMLAAIYFVIVDKTIITLLKLITG
ncbi:MAG: preprotein translocase subunit SecE [Alphaproteobacteria bacterium]|jgi:preprotein translocase subunit SecE|nr:preprotein translocase subunit SecE [Alphaproteobacteria bacterium]MDP5012171.1 preprotein translocase subunit SecE [Alphaproteobacteria bacterium]